MSAQSCPTLCELWTATCQAPLSMEFSRQEYWSELSFPTPGDLSDLGSNPSLLLFLHWQADFLTVHHLEIHYIPSEVKVKSLSCVRCFATPLTLAYQAPLSMGFSRQEYWSG